MNIVSSVVSIASNVCISIIIIKKKKINKKKSKKQRKTHFQVHLTPKYFFRLINLCTCLKRIALLPLFNPNLDLLQALKVMKSGHHLSHDQASKGYGSIPCLTSQTSLHACLQRLNTIQISL